MLTEKNDFMVISNYLNTVLINLLYIHIQAHIYTIYDGYIVSKNRQNSSEMLHKVLRKDSEFNFQQLTLP